MKTLKTILIVALILAIFYFLIANLVKNWQKIPFESLRFNLTNLAISFAFLLFNILLFIKGWKDIINRLGRNISYRTAFWIISLSQVAKYMPGGIWFALGRVYLGKSKKLNAEAVAISVVIETGLTFLGCILLFLLSIIFSRQQTFTNTFFLIPIFLLFLILLQPSVLNRLINIALRIFKRPMINLEMSYFQLLKLSMYFLGFLIAQIIGFYFLINSIYPVAVSQIFELAAAYILSWMIGFVAIFAPGGLGVREGAMTLLLSPMLPTPLAIAISFIARVWLMIFEIAMFFVGLLVKKTSSKIGTN